MEFEVHPESAPLSGEEASVQLCAVGGDGIDVQELLLVREGIVEEAAEVHCLAVIPEDRVGGEAGVPSGFVVRLQGFDGLAYVGVGEGAEVHGREGLRRSSGLRGEA